MKEGVDPFRAVARVIHAVGHPLPRKRAFAREKGPALPKLFWPFGVLVAALVATTNSSEPSTTPAPKPWERSMSFTPVPARRAPVCPSSHPCTSTHIAGYPAERLRAELRAVARHVARRHNTRADLDDLVQIGLLTACALASRFDPARGTTFLTFVYRRAAGAMIDACRRERHLVGPSVDIDACEIGAGSAEDDILEEEERRRRADAIAAVNLAELTQVERQIVEAVVANDGSVAKAGRQMGVCYKTAYARWTKAVAGIRRRVAA